MLVRRPAVQNLDDEIRLAIVEEPEIAGLCGALERGGVTVPRLAVRPPPVDADLEAAPSKLEHRAQVRGHGERGVRRRHAAAVVGNACGEACGVRRLHVAESECRAGLASEVGPRSSSTGT